MQTLGIVPKSPLNHKAPCLVVIVKPHSCAPPCLAGICLDLPTGSPVSTLSTRGSDRAPAQTLSTPLPQVGSVYLVLKKHRTFSQI